MRVSQNNLYSTALGQIQDKRSKMNDLHTELASQKRINKISDDPVGSARVVSLRTDNSNINQFKDTSGFAEIFINYSDTALDELSKILCHAKELTIGQSSDASANADTRLAIANEVEQLYYQSVGVGNRKLGDRFIFGGFHTTSEPFTQNGEYVGDNGKINVEVAEGIPLAINITGSEIFLGNTEQDSVSIFGLLKGLHSALMTNDTKMVQNQLDGFDVTLGRVIQMRAKLGSRLATIKSYNESLDQGFIDNLKLKSEIEDSDVVKAASEIKKEEDLLVSTLNATNRLLQPSLISFLK